MMDQVMQYVEPAKQFAKDSIRLVKRCTKPDRKGNAVNFVLVYCHTRGQYQVHVKSLSGTVLVCNRVKTILVLGIEYRPILVVSASIDICSLTVCVGWRCVPALGKRGFQPVYGAVPVRRCIHVDVRSMYVDVQHRKSTQDTADANYMLLNVVVSGHNCVAVRHHTTTQCV